MEGSKNLFIKREETKKYRWEETAKEQTQKRVKQKTKTERKRNKEDDKRTLRHIQKYLKETAKERGHKKESGDWEQEAVWEL